MNRLVNIAASRACRITGSLLLVLVACAILTRDDSETPYRPFDLQTGLPITDGFLEGAGLLDQRFAYWARERVHDTYVLNDGRLAHVFPANEPSKNRTHRRVWVVMERVAAAGAKPIAASADAPSSVRSDFSPQGSGTHPLRSHSNLQMRDAWPGIDLTLRHSSRGIERIYTVRPGAKAEEIAIDLDGAVSARTDDIGALMLSTGIGAIRYTPPIAYQMNASGAQRPVPISYRLNADGKSFGFKVGTYDVTKSLVIDPVLQGTYLGDTASQGINAMAIDPRNGDVVVAGSWNYGAPPELKGGFQDQVQTQGAFITRFDRKLVRVFQSTFLGGALAEDVSAIAINPTTGDIYITGATSSPDFPGGGGGVEPLLPRGTLGAGFVSRLSSDLRTLKQTAFFSASFGSNFARGIAINAQSNDVYVVGADSSGAVVTRYDESLTQFRSRIVLQGNSGEYASSVAINPVSGDVYVAGGTTSWVFPKISGGAFTSSSHTTASSFSRVFVARFNATLATHYQSTYIWNDRIGAFENAMALPLVIEPLSGDVLIVGSAAMDVGAASGGAQPAFAGGNSDALIVRLSADLTREVGATYFGGAKDESIMGAAVSADGHSFYIGGYSNSSSLPGATSGAPTQTYNPFVTRFNSSLASVESTLFYGSAYGNAVAIHPMTGELYLAGATYDDGLPGTGGGFQSAFTFSDLPSASYDGFVARFDTALSPTPRTAPDPFMFPTQSGAAPGGTVTSAPIRIYGYSTAVPISVTGGTYSLDGQPFTTASGSLKPGQRVQIRHVAATATGGTALTTLVVGGVSGSFESITQSGSVMLPTPFAFEPINPVARGRQVISNPVTITGINAPAAVSISGGRYSIDDGPFTDQPGGVNGGQSVVVEQTTATELSTRTDTTLNVGGRTETFSTVTDAPDSAPHPFAFPTLSTPSAKWAPTAVVQPNTDYSLSTPIFGINVPTTISITGGEYAIGGGPWTSAPGTVDLLETLVVKVHTAGVGSTNSATITVGGVSGTFTAVVAGPVSSSSVPKPFSIPEVTGVEGEQWVESAPVVLTGFTSPAPIELEPISIDMVADAQWFNADLNEFVRDAKALPLWQPLDFGYIKPGEPLRVRLFAKGYNATTSIVINVGGEKATFKVTTLPATSGTSPTPFHFPDQTDLQPGTTVLLNPVTLSGLDVPVAVSASGCLASINGSPFSASATAQNGDALALQITAPEKKGQSSTCSVTVGTYTAVVKVQTAGSSSGGGAMSVDLLALLLGLCGIQNIASKRRGLGRRSPPAHFLRVP